MALSFAADGFRRNMFRPGRECLVSGHTWTTTKRAVAPRRRVRVLELGLSAKVWRGLTKGGADDTFTRLDVIADPWLIVSTCGWIYEDPSDFVVAGVAGAWTVRKLSWQAVRDWHRPGGSSLDVYTTSGARVRTRDQGVTWQVAELWPRMKGLSGALVKQSCAPPRRPRRGIAMSVMTTARDGEPARPCLFSSTEMVLLRLVALAPRGDGSDAPRRERGS